MSLPNTVLLKFYSECIEWCLIIRPALLIPLNNATIVGGWDTGGVGEGQIYGKGVQILIVEVGHGIFQTGRVTCWFLPWHCLKLGFPGGSMIKNPPANAGDSRNVGSIPGSGRSPSNPLSGNPLKYSCHGQRIVNQWEVQIICSKSIPRNTTL